jgi:hypothetical protein
MQLDERFTLFNLLLESLGDDEELPLWQTETTTFPVEEALQQLRTEVMDAWFANSNVPVHLPSSERLSDLFDEYVARDKDVVLANAHHHISEAQEIAAEIYTSAVGLIIAFTCLVAAIIVCSTVLSKPITSPIVRLKRFAQVTQAMDYRLARRLLYTDEVASEFRKLAHAARVGIEVDKQKAGNFEVQALSSLILSTAVGYVFVLHLPISDYACVLTFVFDGDRELVEGHVQTWLQGEESQATPRDLADFVETLLRYDDVDTRRMSINSRLTSMVNLQNVACVPAIQKMARFDALPITPAVARAGHFAQSRNVALLSLCLASFTSTLITLVRDCLAVLRLITCLTLSSSKPDKRIDSSLGVVCSRQFDVPCNRCLPKKRDCALQVWSVQQSGQRFGSNGLCGIRQGHFPCGASQRSVCQPTAIRQPNHSVPTSHSGPVIDAEQVFCVCNIFGCVIFLRQHNNISLSLTLHRADLALPLPHGSPLQPPPHPDAQPPQQLPPPPPPRPPHGLPLVEQPAHRSAPAY